MSATTVQLESDKRRTMMMHIAWRELQGFAEAINPGLPWPMLNEWSEEPHDKAWFCSQMIGEWGKVLSTTQDTSVATVTVPITTVRVRVARSDEAADFAASAQAAGAARRRERAERQQWDREPTHRARVPVDLRSVRRRELAM